MTSCGGLVIEPLAFHYFSEARLLNMMSRRRDISCSDAAIPNSRSPLQLEYRRPDIWSRTAKIRALDMAISGAVPCEGLIMWQLPCMDDLAQA
jgi:hypothetical protein